MYLYVRVSIFYLSTILMFDFGIVGQCWGFFHIIIGLLFIEAKHDYDICSCVVVTTVYLFLILCGGFFYILTFLFCKL